MSCFKGKMNEYRNVSIDRFDGQNLNSTAYFLSHCHEDHTVGLKEQAFLGRLRSSNDIFLYCSEVTRILLVENEKYKNLAKYIKTLSIGETVPISVPQSDSCKSDIVRVTLLHAGHCPGSVMFLFEGDEGTALYTGDFRWEIGSAAKTALFHNGDSVKHIRSIYVDTTFCHGDTFHIPSRQECVEAVHSLVLGWLAKGQDHIIHFTPRSHYGHEHLLKEISQRTRHKIHVLGTKYKIYRQIAELKDVFTCNAEETPIHACLRNKFSEDDGDQPCDYVTAKKTMTILPSTMYFTKKLRLASKDIVEKSRGIYRACYSFHSSYSEVRDLVTYLKPERVRPNVKPPQDNSIMQVQERLNLFLKNRDAYVPPSPVLKKFGSLRRKRYTKKKKSRNSFSSDSEDLCFGTPEKKISQNKNHVVTPEKLERGDNTAEVGEHDITRSDGYESHSSFDGSHDDEELSDTGLILNEEERFDTVSNSQSLLEALDENDVDSPLNISQYRVCKVDDVEQTDGNDIVPSESLSDYDVDAIQEEIQRSTSQAEVPSEGLSQESSSQAEVLMEGISEETLNTHKEMLQESSPPKPDLDKNSTKPNLDQDSTGNDNTVPVSIPGSDTQCAIEINSSIENSSEKDCNVSNNASSECELIRDDNSDMNNKHIDTVIHKHIERQYENGDIPNKTLTGKKTSKYVKSSVSIISVSDTDSEDELTTSYARDRNVEKDKDMPCDPEELEMFRRFKRGRSGNHGIIDLTNSETEEEEEDCKRLKRNNDIDSDSDTTLPPSQNSFTHTYLRKVIPDDDSILVIDNSSDSEDEN